MMLRSFILAVFFLISGVIAGAVIMTMRPDLRDVMIDAKRTFRETMGLPKFWRPLPDPDDAMGRTPTPCPDPRNTIFLVTGGQSNGANSNSAPQQPEISSGRSFVFFNERCYASADPALGATGKNASLWPPLGVSLAEHTGRDVLFVHGAVGGSQAADWTDDRSGYFESLMARVNGARKAGYEPALILWHQGETDAAVQPTATAMAADFTGLTDRLLDVMPEAQIYLFKASRCVGSGREEGVPFAISALEQVALADDRIIDGMNTDGFGRDFRHDGCHFNSLARGHIVNRLVAEISPLFD